VVKFTPLLFDGRERIPVPTEKEAWWAPEPLWMVFGEEEKNLILGFWDFVRCAR
jgi:hypothetical protein